MTMAIRPDETCRPRELTNSSLLSLQSNQPWLVSTHYKLSQVSIRVSCLLEMIRLSYQDDAECVQWMAVAPSNHYEI